MEPVLHHGKSRRRKIRKLYLGSLVLATYLSACQSVKDIPAAVDPNPNPNSIRDAPTGMPPSSQSSLGESAAPVAAAGPGNSEELIYGSQAFFRAAEIGNGTTSTATNSGPGESFIFRNAPIDTVLNQVLGEGFGLSYSIDPRISATITLRLEGISTSEQAVAGLDAALNLQGIEIAQDNGTYIVRQSGGNDQGVKNPIFLSVEDQLPSGTSLAVLQIRYASIEDVTSIAQSMLPANIIRYSDDARGFIVLSGEPEEVSAAVRLLRSLDVNWLSSVSTALIPIGNARPSEIAADLQPILERLGGVSVVPIDRLQTLMLISRHRETLDQARQWIARLDQDATPTLTDDLLIYEARFVSAEDLVALTDSGPSRAPVSGFNAPLGQSGGPLGVPPGLGGNTPIGPPAQSFSSGNSLYSNLSIRVDPGQNAVVARGASDELQSLGELLSALDKPKRQVLIEATIVEVTLSNGSSLGVQWDAVEDRLAATFSDTSSGAVTSLFPGFSASYVNRDISAVLNALATTSDVEIVSSPRMLVLNNETARLQIGDQVPIITQSAVSITDPGAPVVNSTSYRDTGVILTVTPHVRAGGMVEIEVSQEVSGVSETTTSNIDSPTISQRSLESVLAVPDGSTAVLGGLMSSTRSYSQTGVPILKDTPILGAAFRSTSENERRTELVILIEPTVVLSIDPITDIPASLRNALVRARQGPNP